MQGGRRTGRRRRGRLGARPEQVRNERNVGPIRQETGNWRASVSRRGAPAARRGPGARYGRALAAACLLFAAVPSTPALASPETQGSGIEATVVADQDLNVRAGPGLDQPIVGTVRPGAQLTVVAGPVVGEGWTWCQHTGLGSAGWSVCEALATAQELQAIAARPPVA